MWHLHVANVIAVVSMYHWVMSELARLIGYFFVSINKKWNVIWSVVTNIVQFIFPSHIAFVSWTKIFVISYSINVTLSDLRLFIDHGIMHAVYPKKYAHGFCLAVLCCGYTLTDFPISIKLTSLALWQSNDCPSASKATLMNMDKYFMWIHYERLHNHNKAKHNKTVCIFLGIYCINTDLEIDHS